MTYSLASRGVQRHDLEQVSSQINDWRSGKSAMLHRINSSFEDCSLSRRGQARSLNCEVTRPDCAIQINPADVVARRAMAWDGMRAEVIRCITHDKIEVSFRNAWHLLLVYEEGVRNSGETIVSDLPRSTLRSIRRKLTFVPAGHEYREWQQPSVRTRVICIYFDPANMPTRSAENSPEVSLSPRLYFENDSLWETARKLGEAIEDGADRRFSEALAFVVAHELFRTYTQRSPARGGLAHWQQRVVTSYIEEHLTEAVPLAALAKLVNLSPYHFCRAFKQSFGVPPHRYHKLRRIERAKILLANPRLSITNTALTLGFTETSAFSSAFRRTTGATPSAYRRAIA
jgi:AraC family transcriptional regulator